MNGEVGRFGEGEACRYLRRCGYEVVEQNFRCRAGELDIVAKKGNTIHFIEVKTRRSLCCGVPGEAITPRKRRNLMGAVRYYLMMHEELHWDFQIDAVELLLLGGKSYIRFTENVFS